ncbi:hypothetical protein WHR41_03281 [Cladosporium halotolerans]|uniref:Uncharacterized protein n=1 Tax=Cladosporium halotolerans TaxID=1052096 RepID=A0AB34KYC9_9PEZI
MPPRTALSTPLRAWKCPSCSQRTFTSTAGRASVGPEHPRYINFPEPPQQNAPQHKWMKGVLPVPRDVFGGKGAGDQSSEEALARKTKAAERQRDPEKGSREAWKARMAEQRKRNLREGVRELKDRQQKTRRRMETAQAEKYREQDELLSRPEREDERLTTPSHGLDLDALYHGQVPDPSRQTRLALKRERSAAFEATRTAERLDSVNTLYSHARNFIVTPKQLDEAVENAFGTNDFPVTFGDRGEGMSIWETGKPQSVQDMLNRANNARSSKAIESAGGYIAINQERVRRIAEALTGGKMDTDNF